MSCGTSTRGSEAKVVLDILHSVAESENFLVPSVRTDNAQELAREILRKAEEGVGGQSGSVSEECSAGEEFLKFCCSLVDTIKVISTPDLHLKSLKSQRRGIWTGFHAARSGELQQLWTTVFGKLKIINSDIGKGN